MSGALRHRGPDGEDFWSTGAVHLAHRRLAIVDLTPTGVQPMRSASGRFVITFNGEVYNYRTLRKELEASGKAPAWRGSSDTEVMLAAIDAWGLRAALERFVGMFAFALWDTQRAELHLVRDRLGVKPLYWAQPRGQLAFASELKALRHVPGFDTTLHPEALASFTRTNSVVGEQSIYVGTRRLAPGTLATFTAPGRAPTVTTWWSPRTAALNGLRARFRGTEDDALDQLEVLARDAVGLRMVADVPLGAFLSGGVDSSTVVALMQAQSRQPVHTFSIQNETAAFDEGPAARAVATHLGTHHTAFTVTAGDALAVIPSLPEMFDEPFADSSQIPTYLVSRLARRAVTVALSGDGGDELFGGYTRHLWGPRLWQVMRLLPHAARSLAAHAIASRSAESWDTLFAKLRPVVPATRLAGLRMHKVANALDADSPSALYELLSSQWTPADGLLRAPPPPHAAAPPLEGASVAEDFMLRDLSGYLPDDVLTKVDRASMSVSLEAREPLLDHRLVEFAWSLPLDFKLRGNHGKWLLHRLLRRFVPEGIGAGPKMGFAVPLGDWLRGPLRPWAEELLDPTRLEREGHFKPHVVTQRWREHLSGARPWEAHLWNVLMFQAWLAANGHR